MTETVSRLVAVLDANVLYPAIVRNAFLWLAEAGLYRACWSQEIIDEVRRSLIKQKSDIGPKFDKMVDCMRGSFSESWVENYEPLIAGLNLPDPKDRHVLAAAIKAGAQVVVTNNLKDFPEDVLAPYKIERLSADQFMAGIVGLRPSVALAALRDMRRGCQNPPYSRSEFIQAFRRNSLVETAQLMSADIDML